MVLTNIVIIYISYKLYIYYKYVSPVLLITYYSTANSLSIIQKIKNYFFKRV